MSGKSTLRLFVIVLAWISAHPLSGQDRSHDPTNIISSDSKKTAWPKLKADSLQNELHKRTDSLQNRYEEKLAQMDSLQENIEVVNMVQWSTQRIDSLQSQFYQRSDSLKSIYKREVSQLDATKSSLQHKVDSLTALKLPAGEFSSRMDSLNKARQKISAEFDEKLQSIKNQTTAKLNKLDVPPEVVEKVNAFTQNMEGVTLSSSAINIPSLNLPTDMNELTDLPGVGKSDLPVAGKNLTIDKSSGLSNVKSLTDVDGNISEATSISDTANKYTTDAKQVAKDNLDNAKNIPKSAEQKAAELSGIDDVTQETKSLDQYKSIADKAQDPDAIKKEAVTKAKQMAVNHFAGKEEQLKTAMERMAKYKQKYPSMGGVKELSTKRVNPMHGKPLVERIIPGLAMQLQRRGADVLLDFNPYAAYLFTARIRGGLGWNQRLGYNTDIRRFRADARICGPRVFGEFKLGKGFYPRAEIELMNTRIPPALQTNIDPSHREWVFGVFAGMKKQYKLIRNVNGTALAMVRIYNPRNKSPYADILNVRFGFEIPMKKKPKS